jgi:BNR/Asp-box repeat protein
MLLSPPAAARRDEQHDFDFELGTWRTHLTRLEHPLSGSTRWITYDGTSVISKVWGGRANLVELEVDGPGGHLEGLSLRLYNPAARQWSLNFANRASGVLSQPTIGEFKDGRGEFYDQEPFQGRAILVRNVFTDITPDSYRFEQAFSDDGGKTWELNWIATDTRVKDAPPAAGGTTTPRDSAGSSANGHDFDFEVGAWTIQVRRLVHAASGPDTWATPAGYVHLVREVWGGRASLAELEVDDPVPRFAGLMLRLYDPHDRLWRIYWAGSADDVVEAPLIGRFTSGRGEFFDQELRQGTAVFVRVVYSGITPTSFHTEQAISADGGSTWKPNLVQTFTRRKGGS